VASTAARVNARQARELSKHALFAEIWASNAPVVPAKSLGPLHPAVEDDARPLGLQGPRAGAARMTTIAYLRFCPV